MSGLDRRARDLVEQYRISLERRIEQGDWNLVCRDEKLSQQVERRLRDERAQDMHVFPGVDPLRVMEESLSRGGSAPSRAGAAGGLDGLSKAFEVLELAALNLYLCPWRKEYRVVKMFSGMFTHYIKPSLSTSQMLDLFGLLGYQASKVRNSEELCLSLPARPLDTLLYLACAFYTARCECRILLTAFDKHTGARGACRAGVGARAGAEAEDWQLSLVQERLRGHSLEVSLDNTKRKFDTPALKEDFLESSATEKDLDLYTAEEENPSQGDAGLGRDGLHSPSWVSVRSSTSLPAVRDSNGDSTTRETVCTSTLTCRLTKGPSSATSSAKPRENSNEPSRGDSFPPSLPPQVSSPSLPHEARGQPSQILANPSAGPLGVDPAPRPIPLHECCDPASSQHPQLVCKNCMVFHVKSCRNVEYCMDHHEISYLGLCSMGCSDTPYMLCRYCYAQYCMICWSRKPLRCVCGQSFDLSSSV